jgi:Esterase-like activity of phytase
MRVTHEASLRSVALTATLVAALAPACHAASFKGDDARERAAPVNVERAAPAEPVPLSLRAALPLVLEGDVDGDFQPSGLLLQNGRLLTVSDKHDRAIYVIEVDAGPVNVRPFLRFEPPVDERPPLDYEGLSAAPGGGWLVVSETRHRVLHVEPAPDGRSAASSLGRARWLTPSLREAGRASGCLQVDNAGLEGVTVTASGQIVLVAERQERCLIEVGAVDEPAPPHFWPMPRSAYPYKAGRNQDYSDLTTLGDQLYGLARNVYLIVRLERTLDGYSEGRAFSYNSVENDPRYAYEDRTFGMGEGLAIGPREVFVVLDNNGQARAADSADHRPVLFIFERPSDL